MSLGPGSTIGPFKIQSLLGKGGMGEVFSALDTRLDRKVALKILPPDFAADIDRLRRFQSEAKTLASLNHPNILVIHEVGAENSNPYLVSELLEGRTLREELSGGALPIRKAIDYALQIANGLAAAHARGIIHRDLKPENIFITKDARVKILDFGLAKLNEVARGSCRAGTQIDPKADGSAGASPHLGSEQPTLVQSTVPGLILGTPAYMSPEQVRGELADHRSDIFSFGCVLYEMFNDTQLFRRDSAVESMNAVLHSEPTELPNVPPALEAVVRRCLEKSPERRFQSSSDLAFALENAATRAAGLSSDALPPLARKGRTASVAPWVFAGACLLALLLVFSRRFASDLPRSSTNSPPIRKFELSLDTPGKSRRLGALYPAISPDGRKIVYANADGLWLRWLDQLTPPVALVKGNQIVLPFWSPDSMDVAYFDDRNLMRVAITGSRPATIATLSENLLPERTGAAWLAGDRVIFATGAPVLYEVHARGGKVTTALAGAEGERSFFSAAALPAGRGVVFLMNRSPGGRAIALWTPDGQRKVILEIPDISLERPAASATGHILFDRWDATRGLWAFPFSLEKLETTGEPRQISDVGYRPSVSNDGTLLCAMGGNQDEAFAVRRLAWVDRSGAIANRVGPALPGLSAPQISPNGFRATAMAGEGMESIDIWLFDLANDQAARLTQNRVQDSFPIWWDGGQSILFSQSTTNGVRVLRRPAQTIGQDEIVATNIVYGVTASAHNQSLVGRVRGQWGHVSLADTNRAFIPFPEAVQGLAAPQFSPDGTRLAYRSTETTSGEICVADFPQFTNLRQISRGGGLDPHWHPDSSELFFIGHDGKSLMAARQKQSSSDFDVPIKLFDLPPAINPGNVGWPSAYCVSPDGKRFLMLENQEALPTIAAGMPNAMVIQNWSEEFRAQK